MYMNECRIAPPKQLNAIFSFDEAYVSRHVDILVSNLEYNSLTNCVTTFCLMHLFRNILIGWSNPLDDTFLDIPFLFGNTIVFLLGNTNVFLFGNTVVFLFLGLVKSSS